jgi:hypothetical protein
LVGIGDLEFDVNVGIQQGQVDVTLGRREAVRRSDDEDE